MIITRLEAKAKGLKRYFPGKPCRLGHIGQRYTSCTKCVTCLKDLEKTRDYSGELEYRRTYKRLYVAANREKVRLSQRRSQTKHREEIKKRALAYRIKHREELRLKTAEWRKRNPDLVIPMNKRWQQKHRARYQNIMRAAVGRYRVRKLEAVGKFSYQEIEALLEKQKQQCTGCRKPIKDGFQADHIKPLALGGSNMIWNIQLLCKSCNSRKHAKDPIVWAQERGLLL